MIQHYSLLIKMTGLFGLMKSKLIISIFFITFFIPSLVLADVKFKPLVGIPGFNGNEEITLDKFINSFFLTCIALAALLAVVKLVIAGFKYMMTDVVTSKEDAKNDIKGALFGLLVVASTVLILTTINEKITNIELVNKYSGLIAPSTGGAKPPTDPDIVTEACKYNGPGNLNVVCDCTSDGTKKIGEITTGGKKYTQCLKSPSVKYAAAGGKLPTKNEYKTILAKYYKEKGSEDSPTDAEVDESFEKLQQDFIKTCTEKGSVVTDGNSCTSKNSLPLPVNDYKPEKALFGGNNKTYLIEEALELSKDCGGYTRKDPGGDTLTLSGWKPVYNVYCP